MINNYSFAWWTLHNVIKPVCERSIFGSDTWFVFEVHGTFSTKKMLVPFMPAYEKSSTHGLYFVLHKNASIALISIEILCEPGLKLVSRPLKVEHLVSAKLSDHWKMKNLAGELFLLDTSIYRTSITLHTSPHYWIFTIHVFSIPVSLRMRTP